MGNRISLNKMNSIIIKNGAILALLGLFPTQGASVKIESQLNI